MLKQLIVRTSMVEYSLLRPTIDIDVNYSKQILLLDQIKFFISDRTFNELTEAINAYQN